jgi:hypothetical protein
MTLLHTASTVVGCSRGENLHILCRDSAFLVCLDVIYCRYEYMYAEPLYYIESDFVYGYFIALSVSQVIQKDTMIGE